MRSHRSRPSYLLILPNVRPASVRTELSLLSGAREPPGAVGESTGGRGEPRAAACRRAARSRSRWTQRARGSAVRLVGQPGACRSAQNAHVHRRRCPCDRCVCRAVLGASVATLCYAFAYLSRDLGAVCPGGLGWHVGSIAGPTSGRECRAPVLLPVSGLSARCSVVADGAHAYA